MLKARFATAKIGFGNRAILIIQDLWLCVPASRQVCLYRSWSLSAGRARKIRAS